MQTIKSFFFFFYFIQQRITMEDRSQKLWASDTGIIVVHNCWETKWKWRMAMFQKMSKKNLCFLSL